MYRIPTSRDTLMKRQHGRCACCHEPLVEYQWVRNEHFDSLLCVRCDRAARYFDYEPTLPMALAEYLS